MTVEIDQPRETRYSKVYNTSRFNAIPCVIVGCGAIGRQVAIQLASCGVHNLILIDPDTVDPVNLGPQGWKFEDLGEDKVIALAHELEQINPEINITAVAGKFPLAKEDLPEHMEPEDVMPPDCHVISAVDNMEARRDIVNAAYSSNSICIESRMGAETLEIRHIDEAPTYAEWRKSWYPQSEATSIPCSERATIYCASLCASLIVHLLTLPFRDERSSIPFISSFYLNNPSGPFYACEHHKPREATA